MAQNVGIMAHPEVHILISVHIPDPGTFPLSYEERIGWEIMDVMRYASRHHPLGTLEELFRKACFCSIGVKEMVHSQDLQITKS
jgi:hypothetical protein